MKHWPFKVIAKEGDKPHIRVLFKGEQKDFSPEEISAMVLIKMKETAEAFLGATVTNAVITGKIPLPFYYSFLFYIPWSIVLTRCQNNY
jgi:molecular chaperone DnaK (HSP70)